MRWEACRRLGRKRRGQKMTSRTSPDVSPSLVDMLSPLQRPCCLTGRFIQPSTSDVISWCDSQGRDRVSPVSSSILNSELKGCMELSRSNSRDVRKGERLRMAPRVVLGRWLWGRDMAPRQVIFMVFVDDEGPLCFYLLSILKYR